MCSEPGLEIILSWSLFHNISFWVLFHADHYHFALHHMACLVEVVILLDIDNSAVTINAINIFITQKTQHLKLKLSAPNSTGLWNVYNILAQVLSKNVSFLRASGKFQLELSVKITFQTSYSSFSSSSSWSSSLLTLQCEFIFDQLGPVASYCSVRPTTLCANECGQRKENKQTYKLDPGH